MRQKHNADKFIKQGFSCVERLAFWFFEIWQMEEFYPFALPPDIASNEPLAIQPRRRYQSGRHAPFNSCCRCEYHDGLHQAETQTCQ